MSNTIRVILNGKPRLARAGEALSEIIGGEKPCGGHGKCGKCKVTVRGGVSEPSRSELDLLTEDELSRGIRLACSATAEGDLEIETPSFSDGARIVTDGAELEYDLNPAFERFGAAIDVGTTTLAARLYSADGRILAEASALNPQSRWGADVISRIEAALGGESEALAAAIREALDGMLVLLASRANIDTKEIDGVAVTGNTVMLSLLTGEDTEPFSHAPFAAKRLFGEVLSAEQLGLSSLKSDTAVYLPPCISAFVGADTVCALMATRICERECAMLADIGTNGEMAVWNGSKLSVCSTAAGPAFEGIGISMGMRGAEGAIDKVVLVNGAPYPHVIGGGKARGICGSGLVDAAACMLDAGIIDETGALDDDPFWLTETVSITGRDIRMLQLAKSAICAGLLTLAESAGLSPADVPVLFIAGGFGNYLNRESAAKIGLLPRSLAKHSEAVGNAALTGASLLILDRNSRKKASELASNAHTLDLATNAKFAERYMMGMMFE